MANLNFKWGLHSKLPKSLTDADIGSLFFTKDEGALYLGVESGKAPKRIQGVVQYYADLTAFKSDVLPPYSSDIIYYIASENALVRWDGNKVNTDGVTEGRFVVLNVTASEFSTAVDQITRDMSDYGSRIEKAEGNITGLRDDLGNTDDTADKATAFGRIADLEDAVAALEEFTGTGSGDNNLSSRIGALEDWMATAKDEIGDLQSDVSDISSAVEGKASIDDLNALKLRVDGHDEKFEEVDGEFTDIKADIDAINKVIGTVESEDTSLLDEINTLKTDLSDLETDIEDINDKFEDYYTRTQVDGQHEELKSDLESQLNSHINAANALKYIGGVDGDNWDDIAAADSAIGNTYIVQVSGQPLNVNGTSIVCYAGDLLIATAANDSDEVDGVLPANKIVWVHVKAGYNEELASTLSLVSNDDGSATVGLTSYVAKDTNHGDLGKFSIASESENLEVSIADNTVKFKMVWGTFGDE